MFVRMDTDNISNRKTQHCLVVKTVWFFNVLNFKQMVRKLKCAILAQLLGETRIAILDGHGILTRFPEIMSSTKSLMIQIKILGDVS